MDTAFLNRVYDRNYTEKIRALEAGSANQRVLYNATVRQLEKVECLLADQPGRNVLNIGAITLTSRVLRERGWQVTAVEVSDYAARSARQDWNISVIEGKIEDVTLPANHFDFVKLSHVIEHLAEPLPVLHKLWQAIRPGGLLLLETDNAGGLTTQVEVAVRRLLGEHFASRLVYLFTHKNLRKKYGRLQPYEHIGIFRKQSLVLALTSCNFELVELLSPAQGDPLWFPFTNQLEKLTPSERLMIKLDALGAKLGAGEVLVAFARKPGGVRSNGFSRSSA